MPRRPTSAVPVAIACAAAIVLGAVPGVGARTAGPAGAVEAADGPQVGAPRLGSAAGGESAVLGEAEPSPSGGAGGDGRSRSGAPAAAGPGSHSNGRGLRGYDGSNPFDCRLQKVGQGTDFPRPNADPFCVKYDKTGQNVNRLGIAAFLSGEPVRVAAASDKCFYYQKDHWESQLVEGDPTTETYHFRGRYFFDKARGIGGVYAEDFTVNNRPAPDLSPILPERYEPFFSQGRGGVLIDAGVPVEPRCVRAAQDGSPYRDDGTGDEGGGGGTSGGGAGGGTAGDPRFEEARRVPSFTG